MAKPVIGGIVPIKVDVKEGEKVFYCTCGLSAKQPFCDGSHKGTEFGCMPWVAEKDATVFLCTCKLSKNPPLCDGSHKGCTPEMVGKEAPE